MTPTCLRLVRDYHQEVDRYQYRIVNLGTFNAPDRMVRAFAALGKDGWELVTMYDKSSNWFANIEKGFAIFKRTVPDGQEPEGEWASWSYSTVVDGALKESTKEENPYLDPNYGAW